MQKKIDELPNGFAEKDQEDVKDSIAEPQKHRWPSLAIWVCLKIRYIPNEIAI